MNPKSQQSTSPSPTPLPYADFSARIKSKYPEYQDMDDFELAQRVLNKFPEYRNAVSFSVNPSSNDVPNQSPASSQGDIFDQISSTLKPSSQAIPPPMTRSQADTFFQNLATNGQGPWQPPKQQKFSDVALVDPESPVFGEPIKSAIHPDTRGGRNLVPIQDVAAVRQQMQYEANHPGEMAQVQRSQEMDTNLPLADRLRARAGVQARIRTEQTEQINQVNEQWKHFAGAKGADAAEALTRFAGKNFQDDATASPEEIGFARSLGNTTSSMAVDPVTWAMGPLGGTGKAGQVAISALFAAQAAKGSYDAAGQLGSVWDRLDVSPQQKAEMATDLALNTLMGGMAGAHAIHAPFLRETDPFLSESRDNDKAYADYINTRISNATPIIPHPNPLEHAPLDAPFILPEDVSPTHLHEDAETGRSVRIENEPHVNSDGFRVEDKTPGPETPSNQVLPGSLAADHLTLDALEKEYGLGREQRTETETSSHPEQTPSQFTSGSPDTQDLSSTEEPSLLSMGDREARVTGPRGIVYKRAGETPPSPLDERVSEDATEDRTDSPEAEPSMSAAKAQSIARAKARYTPEKLAALREDWENEKAESHLAALSAYGRVSSELKDLESRLDLAKRAQEKGFSRGALPPDKMAILERKIATSKAQADSAFKQHVRGLTDKETESLIHDIEKPAYKAVGEAFQLHRLLRDDPAARALKGALLEDVSEKGLSQRSRELVTKLLGDDNVGVRLTKGVGGQRTRIYDKLGYVTSPEQGFKFLKYLPRGPKAQEILDRVEMARNVARATLDTETDPQNKAFLNRMLETHPKDLIHDGTVIARKGEYKYNPILVNPRVKGKPSISNSEFFNARIPGEIHEINMNNLKAILGKNSLRSKTGDLTPEQKNLLKNAETFEERKGYRIQFARQRVEQLRAERIESVKEKLRLVKTIKEARGIPPNHLTPLEVKLAAIMDAEKREQTSEISGSLPPYSQPQNRRHTQK